MKARNIILAILAISLSQAVFAGQKAVSINDIQGNWFCKSSFPTIWNLKISPDGSYSTTYINNGAPTSTDRGILKEDGKGKILQYYGRNYFSLSFKNFSRQNFEMTLVPTYTPDMPSFTTKYFKCSAASPVNNNTPQARNKLIGQPYSSLLKTGLKETLAHEVDSNISVYAAEGKNKKLVLLINNGKISDVIDLPPLRKNEELIGPTYCSSPTDKNAIIVSVAEQTMESGEYLNGIRKAWVVMINDNNEFNWKEISTKGIKCENSWYGI